MENILIYERSDEIRDYKIKIYNPPSTLLLSFLLDEVGNNSSFFIEWLKNSKDDLWPNNELVDCVKEEGLVELTPAYIVEADRIYGTGNFFLISVNLLIDLIRKWVAIRTLKPRYIKIEIHDYGVKVESCNESEVVAISNIYNRH